MKHKHCFAVKVNGKEDKGRNSVDSHCVTGKLNGSCDNVDPHMGDKVVGHVVVAGFVCVFCIVGAHKVKEHTECGFGKKRNNVVKFIPKHNERCGGADNGSHYRKGKTAGFAVKKIKSPVIRRKPKKSRRFPTSCQIRSSGASIRHIPTIIGIVPLSLSWSFFILYNPPKKIRHQICRYVFFSVQGIYIYNI